jgi:hypothetical protein
MGTGIGLGLEDLFAFAARLNPELLAVFGYGSPGDLDILFEE